MPDKIDERDSKAQEIAEANTRQLAKELAEEKSEELQKAKIQEAQERARIEREEERKRVLATQLRLENRRKARQEALKPGPDIDESYRQASVKVQFMKTRYKKLFEPEDPEYGHYTKAKRWLSKTEYAIRQRRSADRLIAEATRVGDHEEVEASNRDWEKYTKNALYNLYAINSLYSEFLDGMV